ncbi:hypothetical protein [Streptomyces montanisoli]|uniref:Uncharacterized protein n=1 Tax=Streptomyces montanisoli TaxID=2798581 RepID=A0A940RSY8_9ACTN|nr:hypothetical protein [Streptomyces montanisoli]MBP0456262.1 hypothetical protein [Streptomyces montanisoli]
MTEPTDTAAIAVALAELRGTMAEGFATVNGSLNLVTQRHDQTERSLSAHGDQLDALEARLDTVERGDTERQKRDASRLAALEARRWPLGTVSAIVAIAALIVAVWQGTAQ